MYTACGATVGPTLSVVLIVGSQRVRAGRALAGLLSQTVIDQLEILLIDRQRHSPPLVGSDHPRVRQLALDPQLGYGALKAAAALAATAPQVAFLEEHCLPAPDWAERLLAAPPVAVVGGECWNATPEEPLACLIDWMITGPYSPPAQRGSAPWAHGNNAVYCKAVLERYRSQLALWLNDEGFFQRRLRADGEQIWIEPAARYAHCFEETAYAYLKIIFLGAWLHMITRSRLEGWGWGRRLAYVTTLPLRTGYYLLGLPIRYLVRRRIRISLLLRYAGVLLSHAFCRATGLLMGALIGPHDVARWVLDHATDAPRFVPVIHPFDSA